MEPRNDGFLAQNADLHVLPSMNLELKHQLGLEFDSKST